MQLRRDSRLGETHLAATDDPVGILVAALESVSPRSTARESDGARKAKNPTPADKGRAGGPRNTEVVPPLIDQLLLPPKLVARALADLRRIAHAAGSVGALADELRGEIGPAAGHLRHAVSALDSLREDIGGLQRSLGPMSDDLDGLREAFEGSNKQLERLRDAITPELRGIREAAEPLQRELADQRGAIDALDGDLEKMGEALAARLDALTAALAPLKREVGEVRDVVEPLQGATKRVGRLADRLPGSGHTS